MHKEASIGWIRSYTVALVRTQWLGTEVAWDRNSTHQHLRRSIPSSHSILRAKPFGGQPYKRGPTYQHTSLFSTYHPTNDAIYVTSQHRASPIEVLVPHSLNTFHRHQSPTLLQLISSRLSPSHYIPPLSPVALPCPFLLCHTPRFSVSD